MLSCRVSGPLRRGKKTISPTSSGCGGTCHYKPLYSKPKQNLRSTPMHGMCKLGYQGSLRSALIRVEAERETGLALSLPRVGEINTPQSMDVTGEFPL